MGLILEQYQCRGERALYKNVPIAYLSEAQEMLRKNFKGLRYRFRGPRYDRMALTCLKRDAKYFSIYTGN